MHVIFSNNQKDTINISNKNIKYLGKKSNKRCARSLRKVFLIEVKNIVQRSKQLKDFTM